MNSKETLKNPLFWVIMILVVLNLSLLLWWVLPPRVDPRQQTIGSVYTLDGTPLGLSPVMEAMTAHGSVQYFASDTDWLYFEQMAGGLRITLGKNAEDVKYTEFERGGIHYTLAEEPLGSELAWETPDGYLFYLYSSLSGEELQQVAAAIVMTEGGAP